MTATAPSEGFHRGGLDRGATPHPDSRGGVPNHGATRLTLAASATHPRRRARLAQLVRSRAWLAGCEIGRDVRVCCVRVDEITALHQVAGRGLGIQDGGRQERITTCFGQHAAQTGAGPAAGPNVDDEVEVHRIHRRERELAYLRPGEQPGQLFAGG